MKIICYLQQLIRGDKWEDVNMICPHHCVCQYAHRMDLPIAKWVHSVETRQRKGHEFTDFEGEHQEHNNEVSIQCYPLITLMCLHRHQF